MDLLCSSWWQVSSRQPHLKLSPTSSSLPVTAAVAKTIRCSSKKTTGTDTTSTTTTPLFLRLAVTAATEILSLLSPTNKLTDSRSDFSRGGTDAEGGLGLDDVFGLLQTDYANAYFLTGNFTPEIYADACLFEDPTIKFRGKKQYSRNLRLLVPFFDSPSLELKSIKKGVLPVSDDADFILAKWRLRTYLNLPWKPLISIEGLTEYYLNDNYQIIRHAERWNVSAIEAVCQIFKPS